MSKSLERLTRWFNNTINIYVLKCKSSIDIKLIRSADILIEKLPNQVWQKWIINQFGNKQITESIYRE